VNFELNDDQRMMKVLVERFVADRYGPGQRASYRALEAGYSLQNWALLAETGLLALPFAEDEGGLDGGPVDIITVMEAIGHGLVVEPFLQEILVAGRLLAAAGSASQKSALLAPLIAGEKHVGLAFAEHGSRWAVDRLDTRMTPSGLIGAKTFAPGHVDAFIVTARSNDGTGLFLVDATSTGVSRQNYRLIDGSTACELTFDNAAAEPMDAGLDALATVLDEARLAACAEMIGITATLFDMTLDFIRQRRQFGTAIGSFQAIQHRMADLYAAMEAYISAMAEHLAEECVQFHGGMGVSDELDIGQGLKRVLLLARLFGDADHEIARYNMALKAA
jgi:alkylation response protein AidB-like acyl-CoA dehydrogenase